MMNARSIVIVGLLVGLGSAAGFFIGQRVEAIPPPFSSSAPSSANSASDNAPAPAPREIAPATEVLPSWQSEIKRIEQLPEGRKKRLEEALLVDRLPASVVPEVAQHFLRQSRNSAPFGESPITSMLMLTVSRWTEENPQAVLAQVESLDEKDPAKGILEAQALTQLMEKDAAGTIALIKERLLALTPGQRVGYFYAVMTPWLRRDPEGVWEFARQHFNDMRSSHLLGLILAAIRKTNPTRADELLAQVENPTVRQMLQSMQVVRSSENAPPSLEDLKKLLQANPNDRNNSYRFQETLTAMPPREALNVLSALPAGEARENLTSAVLSAWAQKDPDSALQHVSAMENSDRKRSQLSNLLSSVARQDIQKALALAETVDPVFQTDVLGNILFQWGQQDLKAALEYVLRSGNEGLRERSVSFLSHLVREKSLPEFRAILSSLPGGNERTRVLQSYLSRMGESTPEEALRLAKELTANEPKDLEGATRSVLQGWSRNDPRAAIVWLQRNGDPAAQASLTGSLVQSWARVDPVKAGEWLNGLSAGEFRDRATAGYVRQVTEHDPEVAMQWTGKIDKLDERITTQRNVYRRWRRTDAEAANRWLANSGLSEEQRQRFTQ